MAESDSDSSLEKSLDKSQFPFLKKDLLGGTASNISISINVPNATTSQSVRVEVESDSVKKKGKAGSSKSKGTITDSKSDEPVIDPVIDKYKNLKSNMLRTIAARIQIFHETGIVAPEHIVPSKKKPKTRRKKQQVSKKNTRSKKNTLGQQNIDSTCESFGIETCTCCRLRKENLKESSRSNQSGLDELSGSKKDSFGKRNIDTTCEVFGVETCTCCHLLKENLKESSRLDQTDLGEVSQEALPTDPLTRLREREDRLIDLQQRHLLQHSEIGGSSIAESEAVEPYVPQLTFDQRERIQAYVNEIDPDNYSCNRSELNKSSESRINNSIEDYADSIDKKTILKRIDFQKNPYPSILERLTHALNVNATTSTPKFDVPQDDLQSNLNEPSSSNDFQKNPYTSILERLTHALNDNATTSTPKFDVPQDDLQSNLNEPSSSNDFRKNPYTSILERLTHALNDNATTSTPKFDVPQDDLQSNLNEPSSSNLLDISGIERLEPDQETQEDFSTLDRSNITIRGAKTAQSSLLREMSVDVKKEEHIMNYVNELVASESQAISDEVEERFQRLYESRRAACDALSKALNPSQDAFEEEIVVDNSVEIVDVSSPSPVIVDNDDVVCLSNNDSDVELILGPSTSTNRRQRKRVKPKQLNLTAKRKRQNKKTAENPIVVKDEPEVEKKGLSCLILRDCPICLEDLASKEISSTTCGHIFCTKCIKEVIKTSKMCPNCRTKLTLKKIHPLFL